MKVAIITISDGENYGNRLQNFALQKALETLGDIQVETIRNPVRIHKDSYLLRRRFAASLKSLIKVLIGKSSYTKEKAIRKRVRAFRTFTRNHIALSKYRIARDFIPPDLKDKYDYFVVGSDQVWNPHFPNVTDIDFLTFAEPSKRVAYAASFGVTDIPSEQQMRYKERLDGMKAISVREDTATDLVFALTHKHVPAVLDPTLLLSAEEWRVYEQQPKVALPNKYVLGYFLHGGTEKEKDFVRTLAREQDATPVFLMDPNDPELYSLDPFEFLWVIDHAEMVCTNSFHGTVFSILFHKKFSTCTTEGFNDSMSTRFDTLFRFCDIDAGGNTQYIKAGDDLEKVLDTHRKDAKEYLLNNLF